MAGLTYIPDVVTLALDEEACSGCKTCMSVCPHQVFEVENYRARIVDRDACMECGACAKNCPEQAIFVRPGVGCAAALLLASFTGGEAVCGCSAESAEAPECAGEEAGALVRSASDR